MHPDFYSNASAGSAPPRSHFTVGLTKADSTPADERIMSDKDGKKSGGLEVFCILMI